MSKACQAAWPLCAWGIGYHVIVRRRFSSKDGRAVPKSSASTIQFVDQGYTGEAAAQAAQSEGIRLEVVKRPEASRWVVQRSSA